MAVLLVAMSIMAVMLMVAMPTWRQIAQREREQELIFRGQQYARAIGLFERKYANTPPPTLDVLIQEKFLRKKYKDPITNADFVPILAGQAAPTAPGATQPGTGAAPPAATPGGQTTPAPGAAGATSGRGGITGVTSASKDRSIRIFKGATHYNEWRFVYAPPAATPGAGAPGTAAPGQRGGRGQPGQSGTPTGPGPITPGRGGPGGPNRGGPGGGGPGGPGGRNPNPGGFNPAQPFPTPNAPGGGR